MDEQGQHDPASVLGGRTVVSHVGHELLPLFLAARITAHTLSMRPLSAREHVVARTVNP